MVMNTFRSKLRRRRNELFRRSSDEESDEWQFVAFNPSVYPKHSSNTVGSSSCKKENLVTPSLNGNYMSLSPKSDQPDTPIPSHRTAALRPWALKRASWHDGPPPVPPHGQNNTPKSQRPLPPCPEASPTPLHGSHQYPGSVPNWYGGINYMNGLRGSSYPQSVPSGLARPPNLQGICEQTPPVVLRRESSKKGGSRPNSDIIRPSSSEAEDFPPIIPVAAGIPPLVPQHGRPPAVPNHLMMCPPYQGSSNGSSPSPPLPPPRASTPPPPPPPPPPHQTPLVCPLPPPHRSNLSLALLNPLLLSQPLPPSPPQHSSSSSSSTSSPISAASPPQCSPPPPPPPPHGGNHSICSTDQETKGEKVNSGGGTKEQRRSDPGGANISNHLQNPSNGGSLEEDTQNTSLDDPDQGVQDSQNTSIDNPPNNVSKAQTNSKKRSGTSINRSESCKEKQHARKQARENRKNSDPNIPTSKSGDVDGDNPLNFHSGSSSNSSLSQSQESPPGNSSEQVEAYASALDNDSDIEADADLPDWTQRVPAEVVERLSSKDRKRQDTINELFHTEQSHVRVLKVLQFLFHQPLRQGGYVSSDLLDRLFPNLDQMLKFHTSFNKSMKKRRQESALVTTVGDILSAMFEGEDGAQFQQAAAEFVACQSFALESLKIQQKREQKLAIFLQDQENHPHCRRLQLKDMLPAGFQRLSKYPLLLESLQSYTDKIKEPEEYEQICRALERSKEILAYVNASVQDAENHRRLREIQKRLDQSSLTKNKHGNCDELRGDLDLTKHNLIHEGPLTLKTARGQKNIDLHVLILEDCVVLLQKDSDKYILKYHAMNKSLGKDDNKLNLSPIIKFGTFLCREVATDKCGIFIILTQSTLSAQIYELVANSPVERSVWLRHLHEAQASYNAREGRNRRQPPSPHIPDPDDSTASADLRDVDDGVDGENSEPVDANSDCLSSRVKQDGLDASFSVPTSTNPYSSAPQTPSSPESLSKKSELLRRKDLKIRQELEEKQNLIADILNIPRQHFESVADMAGEVGLSNKEPRELVLGAIYQAKKLQEALNEAQTIRDSDVIAAQACTDPSAKLSTLPLYQGPMEKLLCISGTLTQLLNSLMSLVSERDEERDRMRKELVASRERVHQLHMQQNQTDSSIAGDCVMSPASQFSSSTTNPIIVDRISPHSSRPSSYVSVSSSAADQSDNTDHPVTDEEGRCDDRIPSITESQTAVGSSSEPSEVTTEGESGSPNHLKGEDDKLPSTAEEEESEAPPTLPEDSGSAT